MHSCHFLQIFDRPGTDTASRKIDDPKESRIVGRIVDQLKVRNGMLDFGPFEEAETTINPIGNTCTEKPMLDHARLCIGTIKDGDLFSLHPFPYQVIDFFQNPLHFVQIGRRFTNPDPGSPSPASVCRILAQTVPGCVRSGYCRFEDIGRVNG